MGIIIRTAFSNRGWTGRCKNPLKDQRCYQCTEGRIWINWGKPVEEDENGFCKGQQPPPGYSVWCLEQILCTEYYWENWRGKWRRAYPEQKVYLVYRERDGSYTLWGRTEVGRVDNEAEPHPKLCLKPFSPLPKDRRVRGLSDIDLTGKPWLRLTYRYIDNKRDAFLDSRMEGGLRDQKFEEKPKNRSISPADYTTVTLRLKQNVVERLGKIAYREGREVEEIIREAIAEWLKGRES